MVVLSPALTVLTVLLALVGSGNVEAAVPMGYKPRGVQQRKYLQPYGAAPARRFKSAQPAWDRFTGVPGTGEQRFRNKYGKHRSSYLKRSEVDQSANCKRDDSTGPSSIPGYVVVSHEGNTDAPARGQPEGGAASNQSLGNIVVHTIYNTSLTNGNSTSENHKSEKPEKPEKSQLSQKLQLLGATTLNYTLQASKEERSLLYIVPADASEQKQLGEIIGAANTSSDASGLAHAVSDIVQDTVTVNLIAPLLNASATAETWCATFSTAPPTPLHLEPCKYAPGYAGETSSQRFQYSPLSGSLLPLFVQEHAGSVAAGSWGKPGRKETDGSRQHDQLTGADDSEASKGTDIEVLTTMASSFAVTANKLLNLTFVPEASQSHLPLPGCGKSSSSSGAPAPTTTQPSSHPSKHSATWSHDRGTPTSSSAPKESTPHEWRHNHTKPANSSIGSLKPTRHSYYSKPTASSAGNVSEGTTIKHHHSASVSAIPSSLSHHHHDSSSNANTGSLAPVNSFSGEHHRVSSSESRHHVHSATRGSSIPAPSSAPASASVVGWESASSWTGVSSPVPSVRTSSTARLSSESSAVATSSSVWSSAVPASSTEDSVPASSAPPSANSSVQDSSVAVAPPQTQVDGSSSSSTLYAVPA